MKSIFTKNLTDGSTLLWSGDSACQMYSFGEGHLLHTCQGNIGVEFAKDVIAHGAAQLDQHGRCIYMVDCWDSKMTSEFGNKVAEWMKRHRGDKNMRVHALVNSAVMSMLMNTVGGMLLGFDTVNVYSKPDQWVDACRKEIPVFRRRPVTKPPGGFAEM